MIFFGNFFAYVYSLHRSYGQVLIFWAIISSPNSEVITNATSITLGIKRPFICCKRSLITSICTLFKITVEMQ